MKRTHFFAIIFISVASLLYACNNSGSSSASTDKDTKPAFDLTAAKKGVEEGNKAFMELLKKGDSVGVANLYTMDAKLLGPNMPAAVGRSSIQSVLGGFVNAGFTNFSLITTEVWGYENLLSEEGVWALAGKDGKELDRGKYIVLWKMEDGKWKLFRDCWNSDNPPPPPAK